MSGSIERIVIVTDAWFPQVNGVVRTLSCVADELEAMGKRVFFIHPGQFLTIPCPRYPEIRLSLTLGRGVSKTLEALRPDAIHIATEGPLGFAARRCCAKRRKAFTTSYHTQFPSYVEQFTGIPANATYRAMKWFHGAAVGTLVPTPSVKRELDERGFANVTSWTRGVDHETFKPLQPGEDDPYEGLPRPVFAYCGRVSIEKNIEAFLSLDLPGTKAVVGDGPALGPMRKKFPTAHYTGYKHGRELAKHFAGADVFVFPSLTDTFGVVMLEALACGTPVAAYPVTGPVDVITNDAAGCLNEDLKTACLAALDRDREGCVRFAADFTWLRCAELFYDHLAPVDACQAGAACSECAPAVVEAS